MDFDLEIWKGQMLRQCKDRRCEENVWAFFVHKTNIIQQNLAQLQLI